MFLKYKFFLEKQGNIWLLHSICQSQQTFLSSVFAQCRHPLGILADCSLSLSLSCGHSPRSTVSGLRSATAFFDCKLFFICGPRIETLKTEKTGDFTVGVGGANGESGVGRIGEGRERTGDRGRLWHVCLVSWLLLGFLLLAAFLYIFSLCWFFFVFGCLNWIAR